MADVIEVLEVRLGDATTASQKAKVDSSGNQYNVITSLPALASGGNVIGSIANTGFNVTGALPAGAATIGNVGLVAGVATIGSIANTGFTVTGSLPAGANGIGTVGVTALPALPTGANTIGSIANTGFNVTGSLPAGTNLLGKTGIDQTTPGTTNGVQITGPGTTLGNPLFIANATGTVGTTSGNPDFSQLTAGAAVVGKVGIDQTTPGTTNAVQISGPGTSLANPLFVTSEAGTGLTVKSSQLLTSASLAAGSSVTLSCPFVTSGKQGYLRHVNASSSVAIKVELQSINNSSAATSVVTLFNSVYNLGLDWKEYWNGEFPGQAGANGTTACFAVKITNMDPQSNAADVFATCVWTEQ
jgi:hypothetical protein